MYRFAKVVCGWFVRMLVERCDYYCKSAVFFRRTMDNCLWYSDLEVSMSGKLQVPGGRNLSWLWKKGTTTRE